MKFIVDRMLGRLSKWLRVLGYDTIYIEKADIPKIEHIAKDGRIFVTRNNKLKRLNCTVILIKSDHYKDQLKELITHARLTLNKERILCRCIHCNIELTPAKREDIKELIPLYIFSTTHTFRSCPCCNKIFWPGSHHDKILKEIEAIEGWF